MEPCGIYWATAEAPINIALLKYWGKRHEALLLPLHSSVSLTLALNPLRTRTRVETSASFATDPSSPATADDALSLNGGPFEPLTGRAAQVVAAMRHRSAMPTARAWPIRVVTDNSFPTAAGLASSASGMAALVFALAALWRLPDTSERLSGLARLGSGSACRSILGGFVEWDCATGATPNLELEYPTETALDPAALSQAGDLSLAHQIAPSQHWPELRLLVCLVSSRCKAVSSTAGMRRSRDTSALMRHRADVLVSQLLPKFRRAIAERDFEQLAELTMRDSNQLHAICLDSWPPIVYQSAGTRQLQQMVHAVNDVAGRCVAGYTVDAGPNVFLVTRAQDVSLLRGALHAMFPDAVFEADPLDDPPAASSPLEASPLDAGLVARLAQLREDTRLAVDSDAGLSAASLQRVIATRLGDGPRVLDACALP